MNDRTATVCGLETGSMRNLPRKHPKIGCHYQIYRILNVPTRAEFLKPLQKPFAQLTTTRTTELVKCKLLQNAVELVNTTTVQPKYFGRINEVIGRVNVVFRSL